MTDIQININSKTYPTATKPSIANLQLSLKSGEFVCLVGPSGCGKTTLLNIVSGLDNDYDGIFWLDSNTRIPKSAIFSRIHAAALANGEKILSWRWMTIRLRIALMYCLRSCN